MLRSGSHQASRAAKALAQPRRSFTTSNPLAVSSTTRRNVQVTSRKAATASATAVPAPYVFEPVACPTFCSRRVTQPTRKHHELWMLTSQLHGSDVRSKPSPSFQAAPTPQPLSNRAPEMDESYVSPPANPPDTASNTVTDRSMQVHWQDWRRDFPRDDAEA